MYMAHSQIIKVKQKYIKTILNFERAMLFFTNLPFM